MIEEILPTSTIGHTQSSVKRIFILVPGLKWLKKGIIELLLLLLELTDVVDDGEGWGG